MTNVNDPCCRCGVNERMVGKGKRKRRSYCLDCHAAYMRGWRPSHPLSLEQRAKDSCRSYANVYKHRGKIIPVPCACSSTTKLEMHHADYNQPLKVTFICREHHVAMHTP